MVNTWKYLISGTLVAITVWSCQAQQRASVNPAELKNHVEYLASQELAGRYPGTPGDRAAATYIRDHFREYGLTLYKGDGFQTFSVTTGTSKGKDNRLTLNGQSAVPDRDFSPLSISDNGEVSAPVVFLGYGFRIDSDTLKWNDFAGIDVRGKVALILLGAPEPPQGQTIDPFEEFGSIRLKLLNARDAGAAGVILVAGPLYDDKDELDFGTIKESSAGLPVVRVKRSFADAALATAGFRVEDVEKQLNEKQSALSRDLKATVAFRTDVVTETATTENVIGWIQAPDTGAVQQWVVVGAHFDHLGMGGPGSNSRVQDTVGVHPGADDNASGVASVIELAGYLASVRNQLKRSVLFVTFTGEEMGLLGSKYFIEHPPVPLKNVDAMVNLDMVGRPNEEKRLAIAGTGTAVEMDSILALARPGDLTWEKSPEGFGPSDHASFYGAGIPVLYFSTGAHADYHTPGDTPDKLNYQNMAEIDRQVSGIILSIDQAPKRLTFRESGPKASTSGRRKLKVTLGIMPDVSGTENNGLRVEFATPGKPADRGGIRKGDRIVGINGLPVTNIYDYMTRLQTLKPGQTVSVELQRGDKKLVVLVQL